MANELPYFRFTVSAWQNGKIGIESFELKGLFIDVCGYYWINDCTITLTMLKKKFSNAKGLLELIELEIIKHENRHDKIEIDFLNIQYDLLSEKRKINSRVKDKDFNEEMMGTFNAWIEKNNEAKEELEKLKSQIKIDLKTKYPLVDCVSVNNWNGSGFPVEIYFRN